MKKTSIALLIGATVCGIGTIAAYSYKKRHSLKSDDVTDAILIGGVGTGKVYHDIKPAHNLSDENSARWIDVSLTDKVEWVCSNCGYHDKCHCSPCKHDVCPNCKSKMNKAETHIDFLATETGDDICETFKKYCIGENAIKELVRIIKTQTPKEKRVWDSKEDKYAKTFKKRTSECHKRTSVKKEN